jgi:hypothetical protein
VCRGVSPGEGWPGPAGASIYKLIYVSDLDFVDDPGPAELVWSAD